MVSEKRNTVRMSRPEVESEFRKFVPQKVNLGLVEGPLFAPEIDRENVEVDLLYMLDLDLVPMWINRIKQPSVDAIAGVYNSQGWPGIKETNFDGLTQIQQERLLMATTKCRLPPLLAVHLALNCPELDLNDYLPSENDPETTMVGFSGWSRSGKSTMLAVFEYFLTDVVPEIEMKVVSVDKLSSANSEVYAKWLRQDPEVKKMFEGGRVPLLEECVPMMCQKISEGYDTGLDQAESQEDWTLREALTGLLDNYKTGVKRPAVMLVDMNGMRWVDENEEGRPTHIFDLVQYYSFTCLQAGREVALNELRNIPITPEDVIANIRQLLLEDGVGHLASIAENIKMSQYKTALTGEYDPNMDDYYEAKMQLEIRTLLNMSGEVVTNVF